MTTEPHRNVVCDDGGDDFQCAAAVRAFFNINIEDPPHELRPGEPPRPLVVRLLPAADAVGRAFGSASARESQGSRLERALGRRVLEVRLGRPGDDSISRARTRSEDPVVADEVEAGRGHERGELLHELRRLEEDAVGRVGSCRRASGAWRNRRGSFMRGVRFFGGGHRTSSTIMSLRERVIRFADTVRLEDGADVVVEF